MLVQDIAVLVPAVPVVLAELLVEPFEQESMQNRSTGARSQPDQFGTAVPAVEVPEPAELVPMIG